MNSNPSTSSDPAQRAAGSAWREKLHRHPWLPFVLPFAVFMLTGVLEPSLESEEGSPQAAVNSTADSAADEAAAKETAEPRAEKPVGLSYPQAYTLRIALTGFAVLLVLPSWRAIPGRYSRWALMVGLGGGLLWIGICQLHLADRLLVQLGLEQWTSWGDRPGFNPFDAFGDSPAIMVGFLAIRIAGLALIVPLIEEFFLRGFLMRFIEKPDWWTIDPGTVTGKSAVTATIYGVLAHPAEPLAAAVWFSLITLLHARTGRIWNCVIAHAATNALLGLYILTFRDWALW